MFAHARRAALLSVLTPVLVLLAWALGPAASARGLQAGVDKTVFAGALDSTGAPITGLAKEDWGVREAIIDSRKKLAKVPSPRHVIVALNLEGPPEASTVQPQVVANTVAASGASLWVVSYRNTTSNTATSQGGQLRDLIFNRLTTE